MRNLSPSLGAMALVLAIGSWGCKYGPHPEDGQQECYNGECPDGYLCQAADNRCW